MDHGEAEDRHVKSLSCDLLGKADSRACSTLPKVG